MDHVKFDWAQAFALSWRSLPKQPRIRKSICCWAKSKARYQRVYNNLFNRSNCDENQHPALMNRRYRIWQRHLNHRLVIVRTLELFRANKETIFIVLSLLLAFVDGIKHLILDTIWASRKITLPKVDLNGSVDLTIRFPEHSFSVSGGQELSRKEVFNSLGEYLLLIKSKNVVVVEGYSRSKPIIDELRAEFRERGVQLIRTGISFDPTNFINKIVSVFVSTTRVPSPVDGVLDRIEMLRMNFRAAPYLIYASELEQI